MLEDLLIEQKQDIIDAIREGIIAGLQDIKEGLQDIKNSLALDEPKPEKVQLIRKLENSNERVLDSYESFGLNLDSLPLLLVNQEYLQDCHNFFRFLGGHHHGTNDYINGMYFEEGIAIDIDYCETSEMKRLDKTIAHEYAHGIYSKIRTACKQRIESASNNHSNLLIEGKVLKKESDIESVMKELMFCKKETMNEKEIRMAEFESYFEEMFADSLARYLVGIHGDNGWFDYSRSNQGLILEKDKEFVDRLEKFLHKEFFEELFRKGLKQTILEVPIVYAMSRHLFERTYTKKLDSHKAIYL